MRAVFSLQKGVYFFKHKNFETPIPHDQALKKGANNHDWLLHR